MNLIPGGLARHTFRKRSNFAIAALSEAAAPILRLSAGFISHGKPSLPGEWRQGVLLGAGHIGDVLYNTASLRFLKESLPACEWHFVAPSPASEVIAHHPAIASCAPNLESLSSVAPIDVAICYNSGAYWRELLQAARLGIPNRVSYAHKGFSGLVTLPIRINYPQPYPFYFRDLVGQLINRAPDWPVRPIIYPGPDDEARAQLVWQEAGFAAGGAVIACFMTSRQASGVCPPEKFAESLACLESRGDVQTAICGTAADGETLERLRAAFGLKARIVAGKLSLLSLGCFLRRCAVVLCPDSGPRHLANAVGTPVVFVRNLAVGKMETGAYLESEIDAAPDLERLSPKDQAGAFALLKPAAVAAQVVRLLDPR